MKFVSLTNTLSLATHFLRMMFRTDETEIVLAVGTGFLYEYEEEIYLITNGHNITGVNPHNGQQLAEHAGKPTIIKTKFRYASANSEGQDVLGLRELTITLYHDELNEAPDWYIHPEHGLKVDVVAIPLSKRSEFPKLIRLYPINNFSQLEEVEVEVADNVYVLGYPFGITDSLESPIWKRASVATEPNLDYQGLPKLLIDTATRSGMSGSPVVLMRTGLHGVAPDGSVNGSTSIGTLSGFVGIYSGRIGEQNEISAQLGIVWKKEVIEEIIKGKVVGKSPFLI